MKAVAATEFLLFAAVLAIAYLAWMQQAQLVDLEADVDALRRNVSDLTPKPRTPRKPKETTA